MAGFAYRFTVISLALLGMGLGGCAGESDRGTELRETLEAMETAMESRDISEFMDHVSGDYKDSQNRVADDIRRVAQIHALGNRNMHILSSIGQMSIDGDFAEAVVFVAVAAEPIDSPESLASMRAELLRFRVEFRYQDQWQVSAAEWKGARLNDFN